MWYKFTKHDTKNWVDRIDKLLRKYNNRVHSSIHMTPKKASEPSNEPYLLELQDAKVDKIKATKPRFKINDIVRISKQKGIFDKGYTANWSFDLFKIVEVLPTKPPTYKLYDLQRDKVIEGSFYNEELQHSQIKYSKEGLYLPEHFPDYKES